MKAIIIGATGLTGNRLVTKLLSQKEVTTITCLARNVPVNTNKKVKYKLIDFNSMQNIKITADVAFSCLGTTIKNAGSKENFYIVDYHYNLMFAKACKKQGIQNFILMSAIGADSKSSVFYNRIKGQLEDAIIKLKFKSLTIVRPSVIEGPRIERRIGELVLRKIMFGINPLLQGRLRKYRSVNVDKIVSAMINGAILNKPGITIIENQEILSYN